MCRPPCCKPSNDGAGFAAVAVIAAVVVAAKIGPAVARIWHIAVEALVIFTLTAASAVVAIVVTCVTARILRARRQARQQIVLHPVQSGGNRIDQASELDCLACGDTGTVLRAISGSRHQTHPCPECQPQHRAGWS